MLKLLGEVGLLTAVTLFLLIGKVEAQECGGELTELRGRVLSPGYRSQYEPNLFCVWEFNFSPTDQIVLRFRDLNMENGKCEKDYIKIKFSNKEEITLCGFATPRGPLSGAAPATITFVSDDETNYRGFFLQYLVRKNLIPRPDPCASNPCENEGVCENQGGVSYTCSCTENFTGERCEIEINKQDIDHCDPNPCLNDGTCTSTETGYECICTEGWEGKNCDQEIIKTEACDSNPCQNGGICRNVENEYECDCTAGWEGSNCEINIDECASNPCKNGGTCEDLVNQFMCTCTQGWTGTYCAEEAQVDECASNPCKNGATCVDGHDKFTCKCEIGWAGTLCEENINECSSNPCMNDGTCIDELARFTCNCKAGWSGAFCTVKEEVEVNECASNPCKNGGKCIDGNKKFSCECRLGWTGTTCSININDCIPNPCEHGGTCEDKLKDFVCTCTDIWTGKTCNEKKKLDTPEQSWDPNDPCSSEPCYNEAECIDMGGGEVYCLCLDGFEGIFCEEGESLCVPNPCQNEGKCVAWKESYTCTCAAGWKGDDCEKNIDECASNPCPDDLICVDKVNEYKCRKECEPGYTGEDCEIEINECESEPCRNGGTCLDEINQFSCKCLKGYEGDFCEISNPCGAIPCKNGGTCHNSSSVYVNSTTGYACACELGWTGLTCEKIVVEGCSNPDESSEGLVPYGVTLEFFCSEGFVLTGPSLITCQDNGEFTYVIPECVENGTDLTLITRNSPLKSPMIISMFSATGVIVLAIIAFVLYLTVFAPWKNKRRPVTDFQQMIDIPPHGDSSR